MQMKNFSARLATVSLSLILSACNLAGEKRDVAETKILGFFEIESAAVSDEYLYDNGDVRLRDIFSSVWGTVFLSDETASFKNIYEIVPGCQPSNLDQAQMAALRFIDVGDLTITRGSDGIVIDKSEKNFSFFNFMFLAPGQYQNRISGLKNSLKFDQDFLVPTSAEGISVSSGAAYPKQALPSPKIEENTEIHIQKSSGAQLDFSGNTDALWVRVVLEDLEGASVTCYGVPNETLSIPPEALKDFANTANGSLHVDFLSVAMRNDVPRIRESYVRSFTRHRHGVQVFRSGTDTIGFNFGVLRFE